MDRFELLISKLKTFKEDLSKDIGDAASIVKGGLQVPAPHVNLNNPYNEQAPSAITKKPKSDQPYGKITIKDPKPNKLINTEHPFGRVIRKEELEFNKCGQWSLKKDAVNPKLAPKDVKVKQLQAQIDAGTYKPDPVKIADKMLEHPEKPLEKAENKVIARLKNKDGSTYHYDLTRDGKSTGNVEVIHTPQGQQDHLGLEARSQEHHAIKGTNNHEEREAVKAEHLKQFPKHRIY